MPSGSLFGGPGLLRPRHRPRVPRCAERAALRDVAGQEGEEGAPAAAGRGRGAARAGPATGDDLHHRADDQAGNWDAGGWKVKLSTEDGWTVITRDGELSAQFEHTVGVTEDVCEVFTLSPAGLHHPEW